MLRVGQNVNLLNWNVSNPNNFGCNLDGDDGIDTVGIDMLVDNTCRCGQLELENGSPVSLGVYK